MEDQYLTTDRSKIISVFNKLQQSRERLSVILADQSIDESDESVITVLRVLPDSNQFYLSLPGDRSVVESLLDGTPFSLMGAVDGIPLSLENLRSNLGDNAARDTLPVVIPESVYYEQKRDSVRLPLGDMTFPVKLLGDIAFPDSLVGETLELNGMLVDLSYEGCRIELPVDAAPFLSSSNTIFAISATLPDTPSEAIFEANVRHWETTETTISVGMQFGKLRFSEQNLIDALVIKLQRLACQARIQVS